MELTYSSLDTIDKPPILWVTHPSMKSFLILLTLLFVLLAFFGSLFAVYYTNKSVDISRKENYTTPAQPKKDTQNERTPSPEEPPKQVQ